MTTAADQVRAAIAQNLRHARQAQGLSIRALEARSGVSKALLSQLERGVANPTVEMLASIAQSLGLSFVELSRAPIYEPQLLGKLPVEADGQPSVRTVFGTSERSRFDIYESSFPADHLHDSAPHGRGSEECAYVIVGSVTLEVSAWTIQLRAGEAVRFSAENEHAYRTGTRPVRLVTIVSMPAD